MKDFRLTRFAAYLVAMNGDPIPSLPSSPRIFPADMNQRNKGRPQSQPLHVAVDTSANATCGSAAGRGRYDDAAYVCPVVGCPPPPRVGAVPGCPGARLSARLRVPGCRCSCPWSRRPPLVSSSRSSSWIPLPCRPVVVLEPEPVPCPSSSRSVPWSSSWPWSASRTPSRHMEPGAGTGSPGAGAVAVIAALERLEQSPSSWRSWRLWCPGVREGRVRAVGGRLWEVVPEGVSRPFPNSLPTGTVTLQSETPAELDERRVC